MKFADCLHKRSNGTSSKLLSTNHRCAQLAFSQVQGLASAVGTVLGTCIRIPMEICKQRLQARPEAWLRIALWSLVTAEKPTAPAVKPSSCVKLDLLGSADVLGLVNAQKLASQAGIKHAATCCY